MLSNKLDSICFGLHYTIKIFAFGSAGARPAGTPLHNARALSLNRRSPLKIVRVRSYYFYAILVMRARARIAHTHADMTRVILFLTNYYNFKI